MFLSEHLLGNGNLPPPLIYGKFFLHIYFSWVEIRLHTEFELPMLLRSGGFMVGDTKKAGVVAKTDHWSVTNGICNLSQLLISSWLQRECGYSILSEERIKATKISSNSGKNSNCSAFSKK